MSWNNSLLASILLDANQASFHSFDQRPEEIFGSYTT